MWREYVSKRKRTTNQSTKFQNLEVAWLTVLTSNFIKPSCRLLELFTKYLGKISQFLDLENFQQLLNLENFRSLLDLENF